MSLDSSAMRKVDELFSDMRNNIRTRSGKTFAEEVAHQLNLARRRQLDATVSGRENREIGSAQDMEYKSYKAKEYQISAARLALGASLDAVKKAEEAATECETVKRLRDQVIDDILRWVEAAVDTATARINFIVHYPHAFGTKDLISHIEKADEILRSARNALKTLVEMHNKGYVGTV